MELHPRKLYQNYHRTQAENEWRRLIEDSEVEKLKYEFELKKVNNQIAKWKNNPSDVTVLKQLLEQQRTVKGKISKETNNIKRFTQSLDTITSAKTVVKKTKASTHSANYLSSLNTEANKLVEATNNLLECESEFKDFEDELNAIDNEDWDDENKIIEANMQEILDEQLLNSLEDPPLTNIKSYQTNTRSNQTKNRAGEMLKELLN